MIIIHLLPLYFHLTRQLTNQRDQDAVDAAYDAQDVEFANEVERDVGRKTAEVAEAALKPCSIQEELLFPSMPVTQDQVGNALKSVSNTLDPIAFADAVVNDAAESIMKMSIGSTTADPPDVEDNLWGDKPWHVTVDLNDLEEAINIIEGEVGATVGRAKGVSPDHLSKIWSIDTETAKRTIDITTQLLKHEGSDHLS